jgi:uncharacterized protein YjiS (DUF1127 family)
MSLSIGTTRDHRLGALPSRLWHAMREAQKRMARTASLQREFDRMDARMLSDIGVSRAQLHFEVDHER